jgi:hypothetical protein
MFKYLLAYGSFSLSASILGGASAIIMWVYCSLRSARKLHDSVSYIMPLFDSLLIDLDALFFNARPPNFLRAHPNWKVRHFEALWAFATR